jgi:uncharacterized protein
MEMREVSFRGQPPIDGYGAGGFRVGGVARRGGLLILPDRIDGWDPVPPLSAGAFAAVVAAADRVDVLLVGVGAEIAPLPRDARAALEAAGIGVEVMATPAACRTYNVLLAEARRVAAALLPV